METVFLEAWSLHNRHVKHFQKLAVVAINLRHNRAENKMNPFLPRTAKNKRRAKNNVPEPRPSRHVESKRKIVSSATRSGPAKEHPTGLAARNLRGLFLFMHYRRSAMARRSRLLEHWLMQTLVMMEP